MKKSNLIEGLTSACDDLPESDLPSAYFGDIVGISGEMRRVYDAIERAGKNVYPVLITGETGTGKGLVAKEIGKQSVKHSPKNEYRFIDINCSAIPEGLLESDLFGHEKGAFTGAAYKKVGKLAYAEGGTVFLDEIGDITPLVQSKILKAIEEKVIIPVGANKSIKVDFRLITATNRDIEALVYNGKFREDLYYRLNVMSIKVPSLRARKNDISALVHHFLNKYNKENSAKIGIERGAVKTLEEPDWPGNVRELENVIYNAAIYSDNSIITVGDIKEALGITSDEAAASVEDEDTIMDKYTSLYASRIIDKLMQTKSRLGEEYEPPDLNEVIEKQIIKEGLKKLGGSQKETAELLGISRRKIHYKKEKYDIDPSLFRKIRAVK